MGLSFSCPFGNYSNLEDKLESIVVRSISLGDDEVRTVKRTLSFNGRDSEDPKILKSVGSGKMIVEGSVSFKQTTLSISAPCSGKKDVNQVKVKLNVKEDFSLGISESCNSADMEMEESGELSRSSSSAAFADSGSPKHEAAIKLQKVYKSFRTRRKLADCAVLIEQSWWKLLDFAQLKHSSISFFDIETSETAISRWCRAKTRAAKVGKGLSKNDKARKLALQHWLEAIDPRHRYGHNLHFYYVKWLQSQCREPFFYWLDIGEGREVNLEECTRAKLQHQCIKYLGPMERLAYEVRVENGRLLYKQSGELLDTGKDPNTKWIFVLSTSKALYVGRKKKGTFQHSSFLAGGATSAAGRLVVENGVLKAVWPHSGHYKPTPENFEEFILFLRENNVDLVDVNMDPVEDEISIQKQTSSQHLRNHSSSEDLSHGLPEDKVLSTALLEEEADKSKQQPKCRLIRGFSITRKVTDLLIPSRAESYMKLQSENSSPRPCSSQVGQEGEEESTCGVYDEATNNNYEIIPEESILKRINSHKETKSYQLGKQLSGKWSTGAGPRISCVRDYPSKLQSHALEQVSLSPRTARGYCHLKSAFSARFSRKTLTVNHVTDNANVPARTKSAPPH